MVEQRKRPGQGPNARAAAATVRALRRAGRLEEVDEALVKAFTTLAKCLDVAPGNAQLWREYRAFEQRLRETGDDADDGLADVLRALSTPVGDKPSV